MHHLLRVAHALEAWQMTVLMPNGMSTDYKSTLKASLTIQFNRRCSIYQVIDHRGTYLAYQCTPRT